MNDFPVPRCAMLVAHPGHELVIHEFVARFRPLVAVLTDGSGHSGRSRIDSTTRVLEALDAQPSGFYGAITDAHCYAALLAGDEDLFIGLAEQVAALLVESRIDLVVGDAGEGWNPVHDIWRNVIDTAVDLAAARTGSRIRNLEFLLFGPHTVTTSSCTAESIVLRLDAAAYERKLASGAAYGELHNEVAAALKGSTSDLVPSPELSAELDRRLGGLNADSYRVELLRPVGPVTPSSAPRVYELYGEMLAAAGRYREAIRYERHLAPVEAALRRHAQRFTGSGTCASSSHSTT